MRLDLTNVSDGFEPVPEDTYQLKILEHEVKAGPKGDYWNWTFEVAAGEHAGAKIFHKTFLTDKSLFGIKSLLRACDYDTDGEVDFEPEDLYGKEVNAVVKIERYLPEGEDAEDEDAYRRTNRIKKFLDAA